MLEETLILALADFGIRAGREPQHRGVWVANLKVAALGVAVKRWVSFHGFSLNVSPNMDHYSYIYPCGLGPEQVTSMEKLLGEKVRMEDVSQKVGSRFTELFPGKWQSLSAKEQIQKLRTDKEMYRTAEFQT